MSVQKNKQFKKLLYTKLIKKKFYYKIKLLNITKLLVKKKKKIEKISFFSHPIKFLLNYFFKNMLFEWFLFFKQFSIIKFIFELIIIYNFIKILTIINFYYKLAYFFLFIFFNGLYLIFNQMDIATILLWIIYFGVIIIFFLYSLLWYDSDKFLKYNKLKIKFISFFFFIYFFFILYFWYLMFPNFFNLNFLNFFYINFYNLLILNLNNELDSLGLFIVSYFNSIFILTIYILFLNCCICISFLINIKKIKYIFFNNYLNILKFNNIKNLIIYKYQHFFIQDYENVYQHNAINKNFKISHKFHKIKTYKRRI